MADGILLNAAGVATKTYFIWRLTMKKTKLFLLLSFFYFALPSVSYADASCNIGKIFYEKGQYKKAFKHMKTLARYKNPCAKYYLGLMYFRGKGTHKNIKLAVKNIEQAAKENYPPAIGFFDRQE